MSTPSAQAQKLEALLARVQHNRSQARHASAASSAHARGAEIPEESFEDPPSLVPEPDSFAPPVPAARAVPPPVVPRPPVRQTTEPVVAPSPAASSRGPRTPLEIAVEDKLEHPSTRPHQSVPQRPPAAAAPAPAPAPAPRASADEPITLADPPAPAVSKPIAQVVSKQPPVASATFGDLLRRSLSLRPR